MLPHVDAVGAAATVASRSAFGARAEALVRDARLPPRRQRRRCLLCAANTAATRESARALATPRVPSTEARLHPPAALRTPAPPSPTPNVRHAPLNIAIAALRALGRHAPSVVETIYLEGRCAEAAAGRAAPRELREVPGGGYPRGTPPSPATPSPLEKLAAPGSEMRVSLNFRGTEASPMTSARDPAVLQPLLDFDLSGA